MAVTDIFGRTITFGGAFAADKATLRLPSLGRALGGTDRIAGFLVQNLNLSYSQMINKIYEVGGTDIFYIGGRTQGNVALTRILGPSAISVDFYTRYGDICRMTEQSNNLDFDLQGATCGNGAAGSANYRAQFCIIQSVGFSTQAQDMLINEQVTMMIGALGYNR